MLERPLVEGKMMHLYLLFILTLDWKHQVNKVACGLLGKKKAYQLWHQASFKLNCYSQTKAIILEAATNTTM